MRWVLRYCQASLLHQIANLKNSASKENAYDLVFVLWEGWLDWILEARCRYLAAQLGGNVCIHKSLKSIPSAKAYFFADQSFLALALESAPCIWGAKLFVWFTHPHDYLPVAPAQQSWALRKATRIFVTCSQFRDFLIEQKVEKSKLEVIGPRANPDVFLPHQRGNGIVGFCARYYKRKNPDLVLKIIKHMPHRNFLIVGPDWQEYERFQELIGLTNLTYVQPPYEEYPRYYNQMDVFVSPAVMEGGPVPLVEAMMCNIVPVASRVGFALDIIEHGVNGYLFDVDSSFEQVCPLIEQAFMLRTDVRKTVEHLTWAAFAERVKAEL
jgi:glycosyltransferase involved in cell wall biosynthesis